MKNRELTNKEKYRQYCKANDVALYQNDWWLDAVCGEKNWDAVIYEKDSNIDGALAYPFKKKYNLKLINMPMLTLGLGPIIPHLSNKKKIFSELEALIPPFHLFDLYFLPAYEDVPVPEGFKRTIRQTYRIFDLANNDYVFQNFNASTRQQIRKALKKVRVTESNDIEMLYKMVSLTFKRQSKKIPYSLTYVKNIISACAKNRCGKILVAQDADGNIHGAYFLAWDQQTAYYVMGGTDPKFKSSAAYSLLMWEAIKEASKHAKEFDFCGSTIPSIARFFKGFGAKPVPYIHLKKVNSKALKLLLSLKGR